MLRITNGSDEIEIRFDHKWVDPGEVEGMTGTFIDDERRCTFATASLNGELSGRGMSVCHPGDNFCKMTGRKKALAYAISQFPRQLRSAIWTEYKNKCSF